jgi:hypothetical protein
VSYLFQARGTPSGVQTFCLPSMSKFSMLDGTKLTLNLLFPGAHIQVNLCGFVFNPGC